MSTPDLTAPVDRTHQDSLLCRTWVNSQFDSLKEMAAGWVPAPMPADWYPDDEQ